MSEVLEIIEITTFNKFLVESSGDVPQAEERLIKKLTTYTKNRFEEIRWVEVREGVSKDNTVSFKICLQKYGESWTYLAKLYQIILRLRGSLFSLTSVLTLYTFLKENNLNLKHLTNRSLIHYEEWLEKKYVNENTKQRHYSAAKNFLTWLQGHPEISKIANIEAFENPFTCSKEDTDRFKVIPDEYLKVLDEHFSSQNILLHDKIYYWLQRLFAARPQDAASTPLDCIKPFEKWIVTMKLYVGKQQTATEVVDITEENPYKMHFLDLQQEQMNMLYNMIIEQQQISNKFQKKSKKKQFLLTYKYKNSKNIERVTTLKSSSWRGNYWFPLMKELFPDVTQNNRPLIKSLKHTGLTKRASQGWNRLYLRDMANHHSFDTIGSYIKGETFMDKKQEEILIAEKRREYGGFKGRVVAWGTYEHMIKKIENDPDAHEMPHGFCPDVDSCGNHFVCIGCDSLLPDMALEEYYYNQAVTWVNKSEKQREEGNGIKADDSMTRAGLFHTLFHKTQKMKELKGVENA